MKSILIVEDDLSTYKLIQKVLELYGFQAKIASNGKEALELFISYDFDLIISDINMPEMSGYELLQEIRATNRGQATPFIFLTSSGDQEAMRKGMNLGADDFLFKPFKPEDLIKSVSIRFSRNKALSRLFEEEVKEKLESLKKRIYYNLDTETANKNALLTWLDKNIPGSKPILLMDIIIEGYKDFITFLSHKARLFLLNEIIYRLKEFTDEKIMLYQLTDQQFVLAGCLESDTSLQQIETAADGIIKSIENPIQMNEFEVIISAIIGIVVHTEASKGGTKSVDLLQQCEVARQYVNHSRGEKYQFYSLPLKRTLNKILQDDIKKHIQHKPSALQKAGSTLPKRDNFENYETKVFFLYPHSIIKDNLINDIIADEYAAFLIYNHEKMLKLLKRYNNSILLINIEKEIPGLNWDDYIRAIQNDPIISKVRIGVLSYTDSATDEQKYLMKLMIECGYIRLKVNLKESRELLLKTLEVIEARGKRKYVRVKCRDSENTSFNIKVNNIMYQGTINDLSSVGMACEFSVEKAIYLKKDTLIEQLNLNLNGVFCRLEGTVMDKRSYEDKLFYLIMFNKKLKDDTRDRIHKFIAATLQSQIENELNLL